MISEYQQLIARIHEFIRSSEQQISPAIEELAERYAGLCDEINHRLEKCADFLDKGMRSEAVYEAHLAPSLFELAEIVNFSDADQWHEFCKENDLPIPAEIRTDIVERLQNECDTEELLSPLLQQYRRLVHEGTADERISVLRQIRDKDPDNPVWEENLRPLEEQQMEELAVEAEKALSENDLPKLRYLYDELKDHRRAVEPPQELLNPIEKILGEVTAQEAAEKAQSVVAELDTALLNEDNEAIESQLQQWEELQQQGNLTPDSNMQEVLDRAYAHREKQKKAQEEEQKFQEAKDQLWNALSEDPLNAASIRRCWEELSAFNREIPEALKNQAQSTLDTIERKQKTRRALIASACGLAVLLILSLVGYFVHASKQAERRERVVNKIENMLTERSYRDAKDYLKQITQNNTDLLGTEKRQSFEQRIRSGIQRREERERKYEQVLSDLDRIKRQDYTAPEEQQEALLEKAEKLAMSSEQKQQVSNWRQTRNQFLQQQKEKANRKLSELIEKTEKGIERREQSDAFASLQAEKTYVQNLQNKLEEGRKWRKHADKKLAQKLSELVSKVNKWGENVQQEIEQAQTRKERKRQLLNSLFEPLPDITAYEDNLSTLVSDFSDIPSASDYENALNQIPLYKEATLLGNFELTQFVPPPRQLAQVQEFLDNAHKKGPWREDLSTITLYSQKAMPPQDSEEAINGGLPPTLYREVQKKIRALAKIPTIKWKQLRYRPRGEDKEWQYLYYKGQIYSKEKEENGQKYTMYLGEVLQFSTKTDSTRTVHTSQLFEEGLTTQKYEVEKADVPQNNLMPQGEFALKILRNAQNQSRMDQFLIKHIQQLIDNTTIRPIPKARILKKLVSALRECAIPQPEALTELHTVIQELPTDLHWYYDSNPVQDANKKIQKTLNELPSLKQLEETLSLSRDLLVEALSRKLQWVGYIKNNAAEQAEPVIVHKSVPEIWTITSATDGPSFRVVATRDSEGYQFNQNKEEFFVGQLLFAPSDGRRTTSLLKKILDASSRNTLDGVVWPAGWPTNARSIDSSNTSSPTPVQ